jgi:hypothetical protein
MKHQSILLFAGIVIFFLGLMIRRRVGRNRFNRRTRYGLQQFNTYEESFVTKGQEGCAGVIGALIAFLGILLVLAGLA